MKIAVVIGIDLYENLDSLPACKYDTNKIKEILKATGEYAEVVTLTEDTKTRPIKSSLRTFFSKYREKEIDEVFFYFSGHGTYISDNVLFCCSDFDPKYPSSTSLSNQEIDDYMRSINPKLAVKILDSCSSGGKYIKDTKDNFERAIRNTFLNYFICMASSGLDESSYASDKMSDFTKSFIEGIFSIEEGEILYRDIQNHISDSFIDKPEQTPQFVTQVTGLEVFAKLNTALKALKSPLEIGKEKLPKDLEASIKTKIEEMESIFVPFDTVSKSLDKLQSTISSMKLEDSLISKYYNYVVEFKNDLDSLVDMGTIATWAYERNWHKLFFVAIEMKEVKRRVTVPASSLMFMGVSLRQAAERIKDNQNEYEIVKMPKSIKSTHPLAFEVIEIIAKPDKRALKQFGAMIGIVHSRTTVLVLSTTLEYKDVGWDDRTIDASTVNWKLKELKWTDVASNPIIIALDILPQVEKEVSDYLESLIKEEVAVIEQTEISEGE